MHLVKLLTAEAQTNKEIFNLIDDFFKILDFDIWIKKYIFWELEILRLVGYDLELKNIVTSEIINNETSYYVSSSKEKKIVPNFLIEDNNEKIDIKTLLKGFKLVSDYLEKSILRPNNISYPSSRLVFLNSLK
jgi:DNA repair protein RecO (recombination protein O)